MDLAFEDPERASASGRPLKQRGYVRQRISVAVIFGPRGEFERAEDLLIHPAQSSAEKRMTVPKARRPEETFDATFLWGRTGAALGVRRAPQDPRGYRLDVRSFETFRGLHAGVLARVNDTSVQAFLQFLERWSPERIREAPLLQQRVGSAVAFRFRYDDEFLHEKNAARVAWLRRLLQPIAAPASPPSAPPTFLTVRPPSVMGSPVLPHRAQAEDVFYREAWS